MDLMPTASTAALRLAIRILLPVEGAPLGWWPRPCYRSSSGFFTTA